jgi:phage tail sheath protein FI
MAETLLSPGVLARENDSSFVTAQPIQAGAAIVGPTPKGPVEKPRLVTSYSQYKAIFGAAFESGSQQFSYFTSIGAFNYFQNGGDSLLVTRVTSGSFTPATSTTVNNNITTASNTFQLTTLSEGTIMNSSGSLSSGGALASGSIDNIRWEIANPNTESGVFSLLIRRGDDTTNEKTVLETWQNLSLDPKAANYIEKVIGNSTETVQSDGGQYYIQNQGSYTNKSSYVRVSAVYKKTPDYFDNDGNVKAQYTASIPTAGSGSFTGATGDLYSQAAGSPAKFYDNVTTGNIQGLTGTDYTIALNLLNNKDDYRFNVISAPGLTTQNASAQVTSLSSVAINRGDNIAIVDLVNWGAETATVTTQAATYNTSYAAAYWPWVQTIDPDTGQTVWVPASTVIPGVMAFTDRSSEPWFAPAGLNRGGLGTVIRAEKKLASATRDTLYTANINPIATFPQAGVVVFGQKTLQKAATALDRVNVRRLLISLKNYISQISDSLVFEQNSAATRNNFLTQVNPYLESVRQRQGLYAFKVVMDESNNGPDVVDRNELVGQIYLQPTKTAEFIILDFNVLPTGATFPA